MCCVRGGTVFKRVVCYAVRTGRGACAVKEAARDECRRASKRRARCQGPPSRPALWPQPKGCVLQVNTCRLRSSRTPLEASSFRVDCRGMGQGHGNGWEWAGAWDGAWDGAWEWDDGSLSVRAGRVRVVNCAA